MKKIIGGAIIFLCGLIVGTVFCLSLSMKAASSYADLARINYQIEQQTLAIKAKNKNDMKGAICHYKNIVEASGSILESFENSRNIWTFSYPIFAGINKYLGIGQIERSEVSEGIYRALLSDALERDGNIAEANIEIRKASILLGCGEDIAKTKELLKEVLKAEIQLCSDPGDRREGIGVIH